MFSQEDKIIVTEGQEDVLLYPRVAEQLCAPLAGNLFGWGAGAASNIAHLCGIFRDLEFKKVAGLLDGAKFAEAAGRRTSFPEFHFECIPAKDIRTKHAREASVEVTGLLDDKLVVRPQVSAR